MLVLVMAGECIFLLPFVLPRILRPTILEVFNLTNLELGTAFSVYGIIALFSYFFGGPLADRFSARSLMTIAMILTAAGGVVLQTIPEVKPFIMLYGFWGLSTILLFWAAMLRYTRILGGSNHQGSAYGILDAGRGLFAAVLASISIIMLDRILPSGGETATLEDKRTALIMIIRCFSVIVLLCGLLVYLVIPEEVKPSTSSTGGPVKLNEILPVLQIQAVWLNALIVLCAYVGYKCTDDFSLYAYDVYGYGDVEAARVGNISLWMRALAAVLAGFLADRFVGSKIIVWGFILTIVFSFIVASGVLTGLGILPLLLNVTLLSLGIFGVRGVYFALFNEGNIPFKWTGRAIGIISVIGFTPDIFMGPLMGYFLDTYPGQTGHQYVFGILCVFSAIGLAATLLLRRGIYGAKK